MLATPLGGRQFGDENPVITSISHWLGPLLLFSVFAFIPCGPLNYERVGVLGYLQLAVLAGITYLAWVILSRRRARPGVRFALTCLAYAVSCVTTNVIFIFVINR